MVINVTEIRKKQHLIDRLNKDSIVYVYKGGGAINISERKLKDTIIGDIFFYMSYLDEKKSDDLETRLNAGLILSNLEDFLDGKVVQVRKHDFSSGDKSVVETICYDYNVLKNAVTENAIKRLDLLRINGIKTLYQDIQYLRSETNNSLLENIVNNRQLLLKTNKIKEEIDDFYNSFTELLENNFDIDNRRKFLERFQNEHTDFVNILEEYKSEVNKD